MLSHVDDVILAGDKHSQFFMCTREAISQMYRWGRWEFGETTFAGIHVVRRANMAIELDMKACVLENVTSIELSKERKQQLASPATPREVSEFRGCCGTMQWCTTQLFVQYAVEVGILSVVRCRRARDCHRPFGDKGG